MGRIRAVLTIDTFDGEDDACEERSARDLLIAILKGVVDLHGKVDSLMADVTQLEAAINAMEAAEVGAVAELSALKDEIATLTAGEITQEQIDALAAKTSAVAEALTTATQDAAGTGEQPTEPPAGGGEPPAEEPAPPADGGETPPPAEEPPAAV